MNYLAERPHHYSFGKIEGSLSNARLNKGYTPHIWQSNHLARNKDKNILPTPLDNYGFTTQWPINTNVISIIQISLTLYRRLIVLSNPSITDLNIKALINRKHSSWSRFFLVPPIGRPPIILLRLMKSHQYLTKNNFSLNEITGFILFLCLTKQF